MRQLLFLTALIFSFTVKAQIYMAKTCEVSFFSEAPMENIDAKNTTAKPILNTANNEVAVRVPIKGFVFAKPLMQEHFNENYMESDKYPNATFKGKINEPIDWKKDGTYKVTITGKLDIHGVEKDRTLDATIIIKGEQITVVSEFWVALSDHKIEIPKVVFQNLAEKILVKLNSVMVPYVKK
jgi:hypothetical protein